jgi:adenosylmethionine-8-amino-7-oxononanoate aminotransferase
MTGIELVEDKPTRRPFDPARRIGHLVCHRLRSRGIILRPLGDVIILMPPLVMPISDIAFIIESLGQEVLQL